MEIRQSPSAVIVGFGAALPKKCISNNELSKDLDTSDEWITRRTGIKQRYIADKTETTASLATEAAQKAMVDAGITASDVDLIVVATASGDLTFPATATIVQGHLGITQGAAFDISAACSGFIYALDVVDSCIKTGKYQCAIVIGAETFSRLVDWKDRSTCVLFGDGAGAVVVKGVETKPNNSSDGIRYCRIHSDGAFVEKLKTSGGVSTTQTSGVTMMNGAEVFRFAIEKFNESFIQLLKDNSLSIADIDLVVPHQANQRILQKFAEDTGVPLAKIVLTMDKHANTSAASIPLALHDVKSKLSAKKNVVLLSMGAGFTWGAALIGFPTFINEKIEN